MVMKLVSMLLCVVRTCCCSRKHSAEEFRKYIEEHQTDFIQFKTDLLLKGVKDPIKRAEAINSIVRSVSVIPDNVERQLFLKDTAQRLNIDERTLVSQANNYIAGDKETQAKEEERQLSRSLSDCILWKSRLLRWNE